MSAMVSRQQQWRLKAYDTIPKAMQIAVRIYEDEYFYWHPGVNPISMIKALRLNFKSGRIVRGASTLPMQVIRMRRIGSARTIIHKIYESLAAIKYSLLRSKESVMKDWLEIAPFGGNTIGVYAASLRYFKRDISKLSWAEIALLAVMPNDPARANLTSGQESLLEKRNFLLKKLAIKGFIPMGDLDAYLAETLPTQTYKLPQHSYHLLDFLSKMEPEKTMYKTTIDGPLQLKINELVTLESEIYSRDGIKNLAAIVIDLTSNSLKTYIGNSQNSKGFSYVDIAQAPRSYGSLLKPFLYLHALENQHILPKQLLEDIPTHIGEFVPQNFDEKFRGAVEVEDIITQSLNVPAVRLLHKVGIDAFYHDIEKLKPTFLNKGAAHYGLSIILGGGESTLWDMCRLYKGLAHNYLGLRNPYGPVKITDSQGDEVKISISYDPAHVHELVEAMSFISRPREEKSWEVFGSNHKVAWKTGTSFGHRDAWSIGFNGRYLVGVWVGNEDGTATHDLMGIAKAAPIMFKIFNALPNNEWLPPPILSNRKHSVSVCRLTGLIASRICKDKEVRQVVRASLKLPNCGHCKIVNLDQDGNRITSLCKEPIFNTDTMMVMPPLVEYYFRQSHIDYKPLPKISQACFSSGKGIGIIYPTQDVKIFAPRTPSGQNLIIAHAHATDGGKVYWYIDGRFIQATGDKVTHSISLNLGIGRHVIYVVTDKGESDEVVFEILNKT
jgi:penicillin-binding protein 1C